MEKIKYKTATKTGLPPGALIHVGKKHSDKVRITKISYNLDSYDEQEFSDEIEHKNETADESKVVWINVDGLHKTELIAKFGSDFSLHPLVLEDILNTKQRPKLEEYDDHLFISMRMLGVNASGTDFISEQISFIYSVNHIISFQEREGDIFDGLRTRLKEPKSNLRKYGADYLLYRLIDTIVDHYFLVIEFITEKIEILENKTINNPDDSVITEIQVLKKKIVNLRRVVSPLREVVGAMQNDTLNIIDEKINKYLRDVYDHVIQLMDNIEIQKDTLSGVRDTYLSGVSNKMNQTMQFLTTMSSIFIPLTFMAGIYGMNFEYIPELHLKNGYYYFWIVMILMAAILGYVFKKKKWF